ncbi:hypothetical protein G7Y79_00005g017580 [Physcia stellaris]|nr:hypothetical protein G7Y79_00005g017580 [Physcia stellaris]
MFLNAAIGLQPSEVINHFRILNKFPETEEDKWEVVKALHTYLEPSERNRIAKVHGVIELLTAKACLGRGLAKHFGDEDSTPMKGQREIVKALHTYLETSGSDGMIKVHGVIKLLTGKTCLSRGLAEHFGDEDSMLGGNARLRRLCIPISKRAREMEWLEYTA